MKLPIKIGDKVLYRNMNDARDVKLGYVVDVAESRALPYGIKTLSGVRLNCAAREVEATSKLFAKCMIIGNNTAAYFRMAKDFAAICVENMPDRMEKSVDLVLFTGGEDVNPYLYGETPHIKTCFSPERDAKEAQIYRMAKEKKIPCLGICRGSQFLNVMNKGRLVQHVTNHTTDHDISTSCGHTIHVTSTHHQMMDPAEGAELLAWANGRSDSYEGLKDFQPCTAEDGSVLEPEVVLYKETKDLCVQYHPEFMEPGCQARNYLYDVLRDLTKL